jgi:hypothetical protein
MRVWALANLLLLLLTPLAQAQEPQVPPSAASAGAAGPQQAAPQEAGPDGPAKPSQELPGVTVQGRRNPLDESDKKLKELIGKLPCSGCDAKKVRPGGKLRHIVEDVADYAYGEVAPTSVPDDSEARSKDPDAVRNAASEAAKRPMILSSPNNNP